MSGEDSGRENHTEEQLMNNIAGVEREVSNSSDVGKLQPSEKETAFVEEAATENGRDQTSDRGEITNLKENNIEVQSEDKTKEQSPIDKTDLESRNGNFSGKLIHKRNSN